MRPSEVLILRRDDFLDFVKCFPGRSDTLLEIYAVRWRKTLWRLAELAFLDVPGRLAETLIEFGGPADSSFEGIEVAFTQNDLAQLAWTSRESVGRWLKVFADQGLIDAKRNSLRVLDPNGLKQYVRWA